MIEFQVVQTTTTDVKNELRPMMDVAQRICIGTAQFGMQYGIANRSGQATRDQVKDIVEFASQCGVNCYDTAQAYGESEEVLGLALAHLVDKESLRVISKLKPDFSHNSYEDLERSIKESLFRLKLPKLWGLLLHRTMPGNEFKKVIEDAHHLKKRGYVDNFGVSVYDPTEALRCAEEDGVDIVQVPFNVLDRRLLDNGFFELAERRGKRVFIRSVFLQGLVLMNQEELETVGMGWANEYLQLLRGFVSAHKLVLRQFSLQAVLQRDKGTSIIMGVDNKLQLEENMSIVCKYAKDAALVSEWWQNLPLMPDRLLNPSLWRRS